MRKNFCCFPSKVNAVVVGNMFVRLHFLKRKGYEMDSSAMQLFWILQSITGQNPILQMQEQFAISCVVLKMQCKLNSGSQSGIYTNEFFHFRRITCRRGTGTAGWVAFCKANDKENQSVCKTQQK